MQRLWLALPEWMAEDLRIHLHTAIVGITVLAVVSALLGACLRTWGTAYLGVRVVSSPTLENSEMAIDGPYRYLRNPLYLGTILHTLALTLLMTWEGAGFALIAIGMLQMALVAAEEGYLARALGEPYKQYCREVPRYLPKRFGLAPRAAGTEAHWLQAFASEIYFWGAAVTFVVFGASYNAQLIAQGLLVSLGVGIVVRGACILKR